MVGRIKNLQSYLEDETQMVGTAGQPPCTDRGYVVFDVLERALNAGRAWIRNGSSQSAEVGCLADQLVRSAMCIYKFDQSDARLRIVGQQVYCDGR